MTKMYRKRSQMNQWDKVGDGFNRQTSATRTKLFDMESSSDEDQNADRIKWSSSEEDREKQAQKQKPKAKRLSLKRKRKAQTSLRSLERKVFCEEQITISSDSDSESKSEVFNLKETFHSDPELEIQSEESRSPDPCTQQENPQGSDTTPCISQATSASTSQSSSSRQGAKVKVSEWVKTLDLKTPPKKTSDVPSQEFEEDSAKKKKKLPKKGIAGQLVTQQARERSDLAMTKHRQAALERDQRAVTVARAPYRGMTLRIQRVVDHCELQLSHCLREGEEEDPSELTVLFLHEKSSQAGSSVQVFAPWQKVTLKNVPEQVMLCSNYRVLSGQNQSAAGQGTSNLPNNGNVTVMEAEWKCPCMNDECTDPSKCPLQLNPIVPDTYIDENGNISHESIDPEEPGVSRSPVRMDVFLKHLMTKRTVADWLYIHCQVARFTSRILRVFCHMHFTKNAPREKRYSLLVEDCNGVVGVVLCPQAAEVKYPTLLDSGRGQVYFFGGVTICDRASRSTDPALFSVIDRVRSDLYSASEASRLSEQDNSNLVPFCLLMKEDLVRQKDQRMNVEVKKVERLDLNERTTPLANLPQKKGRVRVSLCGSVIFCFDLSGVRFPLSDKRKSHRYALYLQDASARRHHYVTMTTTDDFFLPPDPTNKAWLFSDVQYMAGLLTCDKYSRMTRQEVVPAYDLHLASFHSKLSLLDLCTLSGTLCGVDSKSAVCLKVCDQCERDDLIGIVETKQLLCPHCHKIVECPVPKLSLRVTLSVAPSGGAASSHVTRPVEPATTVSVKLLHDSVQELLPDTGRPYKARDDIVIDLEREGMEAEDEIFNSGCSAKDLMGERVGPLMTVVVGKFGSQMVLQEIDMNL
uniref:Uncharacterized protein LOC111138499 isoform X1 n=2 Tax=Crassostrea virginica TaxID=6565 RepID=A0A8B8F310_CRAVI|nr:uncharacterized protein LOC111138499 isoform X1 [Crassostrea virginica]